MTDRPCFRVVVFHIIHFNNRNPVTHWSLPATAVVSYLLIESVQVNASILTARIKITHATVHNFLLLILPSPIINFLGLMLKLS